MFRYITLMLLSVSYILGGVYYAKLEPFNLITIKAEANGEVLVAKENLEGKVANGLVVRVDDRVNIEDLKNSQNLLKITNDMIKLNKEILPDLKKNMDKKLKLYKQVINLDSTSQNTKDTLYSAYISAKNQYFATKEKILNLQSQRVNLKQKIVNLKDLIRKKNIKVNNWYLYSLNVRRGEFVNIGYPLLQIADISKAKLTIYLNREDLKDIDKKSIYIDGKKSNLKFYKIWKIADKEYISSYKAEIVLKPFKRFSELVKVEIK